MLLLTGARVDAQGISGATNSTTGASCTGGGMTVGDCRNTVTFLVKTSSQLQSRYAWNINADALSAGTWDTSGTAQHNLVFNVTAPGGYRLDITTQRVGGLNRLADDSGCMGSADTSSVTGTSNIVLSSGSLNLADPGVIASGGTTTETPFNQTSSASIFRVSNGVAQSHSFTFTWNGSVHSSTCEVAVRQGESSGTTTGCTACGYPGDPPRTQSSDGHFVTVTFTSLCGNGTVDTVVGEQCDEGVSTGTSTSCCNTNCTWKNIGNVCRAAAGECDVAETCPASASCPADAKKANGTACTDDGNPCTLDQCDGTHATCQHPAGNGGTVCRAMAGACDVAENCTGTSTTCPPDAKSTAVCRPSVGICDVAESCDGTSNSCPSDGFAASTIVCRASAGECDVAESCTGTTATCLTDAKQGPGTPCTDDGDPCTVDQCNGSNVTCQHTVGNSGVVCRASAGPCDPAETCSGTGLGCPADAKSPAGTVCRATAGTCDVAETCDGTSNGCPADAFVSSSSVCRAAAGVCDVAENCTGSSAACPTDAFVSSSTVCRAAAGICDVAENCTGSSAACPTDAFVSSSTACRAAAGVCDVAENCTGTSAACPADTFALPTTVCRTAADECDVAETCTGSGPNCPADAKKSAGTTCSDDGNPCTLDRCDGTNVTCQHPAGNAGATCRGAAGACDVAETCTGTSVTCPADAFAAPGTLCRAAAGECDVAETCTGASAQCPTDAVKSAGSACTDDGNPCTLDQCDGTHVGCQHPAGNPGTVCRAAAGACDVAESCTGTSTTCPPDVKSTTVCRAAAGICDVAESCDGSSISCPPDAFAPTSTVCRTAADECDLAETCTGSGPTCPADAKKSAGTTCSDDANPCTLDRCDGTNVTCQHPAGNAGGVCRAAAGACDVAETCDGTSTGCLPDTLAAATVVCRAAADVCDAAEHCTGTSASCPPDAAAGTSVTCRPAAGPCDVAEHCDGSRPTCPPDAFQPSTVQCRAAAGVCDIAETCTGASASCPADRKSTAPCRAAAGPCDVAESCGGAGNDCPPDALAPNTTVCRPATGPCDVADACTGTGASCPADAFQPDGRSCSDGNACTTGDACRSGTCVGNPVGPGCLDHFLCYKVRTSPFTPAVGVHLVDAFDDSSFDLRKLRQLCNPADENGGGILDPATHVAGYENKASLGASRFVRRNGVRVTNQLGQLTVDVKRPNTLFVPSAEDVTATPPAPDPQTINVDHYECYKIGVSSGTTPFPSGVQASVADAFTNPAKVFDLRKPRHLCAPARKDGSAVKDGTTYLLCYQARPAGGQPRLVKTTAHVNNELGPDDVTTISENELCIPSTVSP